MKQLFKLFFLRPGDIFLVLRTSILLGLVRLGLWLLPFANLQKFLATLSQLLSPSKRSGDSENKTINFKVKKIIWAVNVSSKYMPGKVKCLARALTTELLMNLRGYEPELRIGVAKGETGKLQAHAWVESQGKVLIGQLEDLARFQVLPLPTIEVKQS
ncbi:MAG: lasso peptide biosynthesis B2 protein [Xenococcaceae cyanobacterium MO_188.B19]|nr:lasso peptide biosynthesis B2 protein [Xenococcaceae cyanobacterium MO_188.B19]